MTSYSSTLQSRHHVGRKRPGLLYLGIICILVLITNGWSQEMKTRQLPAREVPKFATIEVVLVSPRIDDEESKWEIAYELRITDEAANEAAYFEARKQGKPEGRAGELIKDADVRKPLRSLENHKFVFEVPLSPEIQERLRNQPSEHLRTVTMTSESNKALKEQASKFQLFKFYSVINIYDARLNKTFLIPVTQTWDFARYPDARFGFTIEINSDGAYRWKTNRRANSSSPVIEIRKP